MLENPFDRKCTINKESKGWLHHIPLATLHFAEILQDSRFSAFYKKLTKSVESCPRILSVGNERIESDIKARPTVCRILFRCFAAFLP